jgi:hypothetical protein
MLASYWFLLNVAAVKDKEGKKKKRIKEKGADSDTEPAKKKKKKASNVSMRLILKFKVGAKKHELNHVSGTHVNRLYNVMAACCIVRKFWCNGSFSDS